MRVKNLIDNQQWSEFIHLTLNVKHNLQKEAHKIQDKLIKIVPDESKEETMGDILELRKQLSMLIDDFAVVRQHHHRNGENSQEVEFELNGQWAITLADPDFQRLVNNEEDQLLQLQYIDDEIDAYSMDEDENELQFNEMDDNDVYEVSKTFGDDFDLDVPLELEPLPMPSDGESSLSRENIYLIFLFGVCVTASILLCVFKKYWSKTEVLDGKEVHVENMVKCRNLAQTT